MASSRRLPPLTALLAAACFLATVPGIVAAESVTGQIIRQLNGQLLYMAVPIAVLVEVILVYAVVRFRNSDEPLPTKENRQLEITWTVATGLVLLFVGTASFTALLHPMVAAVPASAADAPIEGSQSPGEFSPDAVPENTTAVVGVARQWDWSFEYPGAGVTSDELVVPRDRNLSIYVTSEDVLHSMHVPGLGLKQDAFPGQYNLVRTEIVENGTYRMYCAEFCGTNHASMETTVRVVDADTFDEWLASGGDGNATALAAEDREGGA